MSITDSRINMQDIEMVKDIITMIINNKDWRLKSFWIFKELSFWSKFL
jgi:hypothetical protein